jgi:putative transposase
MSRPLRIEFAGGLYHVTSPGDGREAIFLTEEDRRLFLGVLSEVVPNFNWAVHAYCLMDNHYHLLIETPDGNLSKGMRQLNGVYTQRFNRQYGRVGHVFQRSLQGGHRAEGVVPLGTGPLCRPQSGQSAHGTQPG